MRKKEKWERKLSREAKLEKRELSKQGLSENESEQLAYYRQEMRKTGITRFKQREII